MTQLQIECFQAAVQGGSIAAASRELYLSVQAVSQHIQNLEAELGTPLFVRSTAGVELTPEGERFLICSTRMTGLYTHTLHTIREQYRNMSLHFTIGLSDYIDGVGRISGGITEFARQHNAADITGIQISNREIMQAISDGRIDVALMSDSQIFAGGDYDLFPFAAEDLRLYVSHTPLPEGCTLEAAVALCRELPHLDASYGPWSGEEWAEISKRMSSRLGLRFSKHWAMPNFRSVIASLQSTPCTAVCDARFGYLQEADGISSFPLAMKSSLCVVSDKTNENPLIQDFCEHMKSYYKEN